MTNLHRTRPFQVLLLLISAYSTAAEDAKPNVVYLLADDLGWSDSSAHTGGSIPTPVIENLNIRAVTLDEVK